ncbi:hypothetical protein Tco_1077832 [Tanacetum coccineum]
MNVEQASLISEESALVLHASVEKSSEENTSEKIVSDDEPLVKKLKFLIPTPSIPSPTHLNSIMPEPTQKPDVTKMTIDESKGKGIATEEPLKDIMSFMEEGGSVPKIPSFKSFVIPKGQLTNEDVMAQVKEMKRLADLKAEKEKSEKLKTLGFSEWLEVHALASKSKGKSNDLLPQSLKAKFEWVLTQARKLGVLPLPELSTFGISVDDKKRKRSLEILQEVFVKENIVVDGMHWNIIPPLGVEGIKGLVIKVPESGIFYYNGNFDLAFQREEEFHLATTAQLIRLHDAIQRGTLEAEEMFKKIGLTIIARDDVD